MYLFELNRPPRLNAGLLLTKAGYIALGEGSYGSIYQKPGAPYALKTFGADDKAYLAYIALCRKHPENPHFPKFFGKLVQVTDDYYAIRIEVLQRYKHDPYQIYNYLRLRDFARRNPSSHSAEVFEDALDWLEEVPQLIEALDLILDKLPDFAHDIKTDNIMLRNNTMVLIDPVKNRWAHQA